MKPGTGLDLAQVNEGGALTRYNAKPVRHARWPIQPPPIGTGRTTLGLAVDLPPGGRKKPVRRDCERLLDRLSPRTYLPISIYLIDHQQHPRLGYCNEAARIS